MKQMNCEGDTYEMLFCWVRWLMSTVSVFGRLRLEDYQMSEATLGYRMGPNKHSLGAEKMAQ